MYDVWVMQGLKICKSACIAHLSSEWAKSKSLTWKFPKKRRNSYNNMIVFYILFLSLTIFGQGSYSEPNSDERLEFLGEF